MIAIARDLFSKLTQQSACKAALSQIPTAFKSMLNLLSFHIANQVKETLLFNLFVDALILGSCGSALFRARKPDCPRRRNSSGNLFQLPRNGRIDERFSHLCQARRAGKTLSTSPIHIHIYISYRMTMTRVLLVQQQKDSLKAKLS